MLIAAVRLVDSVSYHYENKSMQYTAIFHGSENDKFHLNFLTISYFCSKTNIVGTR